MLLKSLHRSLEVLLLSLGACDKPGENGLASGSDLLGSATCHLGQACLDRGQLREPTEGYVVLKPLSAICSSGRNCCNCPWSRL